MKYKFYAFIFFYVFIVFPLFSQSTYNYKIDTFTSSYDTLTEFSSIPKELVAEMDLPWSSWSRTFPLEFPFPYFDTITNELILENFSIGIIPGSPDYNLYLFNLFWGIYTKGLKLEDFTSEKALQSDFRYNHVTKNGKKAFVMEYKNVGFDPAQDADFYSSGKVNFQTWFWENGDIELKFGEVNLDGLFFNGKIPDIIDSTSIFLFFRNINETKNIIIEGNLEEYKVSNGFNPTTSGYLKSLPHKDFVFRFTYLPTATNEVAIKKNQRAKLVTNAIEDESYNNKNYSLYNLNGTMVKHGLYYEAIDVANLPQGIYFLNIEGHNKISSEQIKIVKL